MQGNILNKTYQVQSQLSQRGGRATFLAKNLHTNELVVVKLLRFGFDAVWSDFKLFEREAQTLKNINHPAIPNYLDYFELDLPDCKGFALVQEYIPAPSLEAAIKAGRTFSELEIQEIAEALLNILLYLHQQQPSIIHRDIKPSNILLTDRSGNSVGQIYLIDFGAVKNIAAADGGTITVVGTYGYMPPEQFGGQTTPASDLYSLGATLIYLATGRHPTELPSKDGKIVFAESVQLNPQMVQWLEQLIEPSRDRRFRSATEALQSLKFPRAKEPKIELFKSTTSGEEIVQQPSFSRIKVQKTSAAIDILVPSPGLTGEIIFLTFFAIAWNSFLVFWTGATLFIPFPGDIFFALFSLPFWGVGLTMIGSIFFTIWGTTRLRIDTQRISLTYECCQIKFHKPKPTARQNITAVEYTTKDNRREKSREKNPITPVVVIWANGKPYRLHSSVKQEKISRGSIQGYNPAEVELKWLGQEISQWLEQF